MKDVVVDALEDCLERLQAGASLEQVLALYPQWAEEMRPLLESSLLAWSLRVTTPVPAASMARSRKLFIEKTAAQPQPGGIYHLGIRFSHSLIALLSAAVILAVGSTFVSAQSLPGDILYPVKLVGEQTRLLLTTNTHQRLILQERYDETRASEVENVIRDHRTVDVTFVGLLTKTLDNHWQVAGVNVVFPSDLNTSFSEMVNSYVDVTGVSQSDGTVQVSQIHLRELTFSGTVTSMTLNMLNIDQVGVGIEDTTKITGTVALGAYVWVNAYRQEDGSLFARQIVVIDPAKQEVQLPTAVSPSSESKAQSNGSGKNPTGTADMGTYGSGDATPMTDTATSRPASTSESSPTGTDGQVNTPTLPTDSPTFTQTLTLTSTSTVTATLTPTPTDTKENRTRPPDGGTRQSTPTPTSRPHRPDQGG